MVNYHRIRALREDSDKTQSEIASYLGTTAQYYGRYEKGECEMPLSRAIQLADYYNVSIDYLVGRTNKKEHNEEMIESMFKSLNNHNRTIVSYIIEELLIAQKAAHHSEN